MLLDLAYSGFGSAAAFSAREESAWVRPQRCQADVLTRPLATPLGREAAYPCRIEFTVGGDLVAFEIPANAPPWAIPVLRSIASRWGSGPGWDGHQARPTDPRLVAELLRCLGRVMPSGGRSPVVTPLYDGGVQAEWHRGEESLEIVVSASEAPSFHFFAEDAADDREGLLTEAVNDLQQLISRF